MILPRTISCECRPIYSNRTVNLNKLNTSGEAVTVANINEPENEYIDGNVSSQSTSTIKDLTQFIKINHYGFNYKIHNFLYNNSTEVYCGSLHIHRKHSKVSSSL